MILPLEDGSYVVEAPESNQKGNEAKQLVISWVFKPRLDSNAIVLMQAKGIWAIIDNDGPANISRDAVQIFNECGLLLDARISKEALMDHSICIDEVDNRICIPSMACSVQYYVKVACKRLQEQVQVWSFEHIKASGVCFLYNFDPQVSIWCVLVTCMDQRFIEVEDQREGAPLSLQQLRFRRVVVDGRK